MRKCDKTGKKSYARFGDAQAAARRTSMKNTRVNERKVEEYRCQHCGQWHVGRTPFWINLDADRKFKADRAMGRLLELRARLRS
jgi:ribosomal protein L37AE/L43A